MLTYSEESVAKEVTEKLNGLSLDDSKLSAALHKASSTPQSPIATAPAKNNNSNNSSSGSNGTTRANGHGAKAAAAPRDATTNQTGFQISMRRGSNVRRV